MMKCIIGLGNPGKKYEETRHNIGFIIIDELLRRLQISDMKQKFKCLYTIEQIEGQKVMFVKPQTFMNLSGEGVRPLLDYYNVDPKNTVVIYDDLDLPVGKIRLRQKGGHGGHNGLRSLIDHLGTKEFKRLRIGIGRPEDRTPIVRYVLQPFPKEDQHEIENAIGQSTEAIQQWMHEKFIDVMNKYN